MKEKILTYHEIFDRNAEQIRSVCKKSQLWIHSNLLRANFKFTYSLSSLFRVVDIWTFYLFYLHFYITFYLQFLCVAGYLKCSDGTSKLIWICTSV